MKKILNPAKPIHAWTLDGTKVGVFPSGREAVDTLCRSQGVISNAARNWKILGGKYVVSYHDIFPGVPPFSHKSASHVWVWSTVGEPIGDYPSQERAAKALGISPQSVRDSVRRGSIVKKKYVFTDSPEPPVLSRREAKVKPVSVKQDKYRMEQQEWVSLGEFKDMEDASNVTGLHPRTIRRMISNGRVYKTSCHAKMKGKLICIEKREWQPAGKFKTLVEISAKIGVTPISVCNALKNGWVIGGKYKVSRIAKPIPEPTV